MAEPTLQQKIFIAECKRTAAWLQNIAEGMALGILLRDGGHVDPYSHIPMFITDADGLEACRVSIDSLIEKERNLRNGS